MKYLSTLVVWGVVLIGLYGLYAVPRYESNQLREASYRRYQALGSRARVTAAVDKYHKAGVAKACTIGDPDRRDGALPTVDARRYTKWMDRHVPVELCRQEAIPACDCFPLRRHSDDVFVP